MAARSGAAMAEAPAAQLAAACAGCHSSIDSGIRPILGLDESGIVQAMNAYRSGERHSQIMRVVADALSPEETQEVARYLAGQPRLAARP